MRAASILLVAALVALAGCGDDDEPAPPTEPAPRAEAPPTQAAPAPRGTTIALRDSEFGPMLFDSKRQAIYIFENDPKGKTVCYDECAEAWPPVYTEGEPRARDGVKQSLLGTIERRDGRRQVTYAGKPLYFYAHEEPGEVRCHNVDLNGGLWWVVGADGKRRP
jgi:predicted lipoprotein with Yx(FWY)xxD motif